jgi:hypothetical protein
MRLVSLCPKVLAINILAMPNLDDKDYEALVFDFANKPVIPHAIFPEFPKPGTLQGPTNATRIV